MDLRALLKAIERNPKLYIGNDGIYGLRHFLAGYIIASQENNTYDDWLFSKFTLYLAEKYKDRRSYDWADLIDAHETGEDKVSAFFRLLEEYYNREIEQ